MKLATARKFALSLAEVTEEPHHQFSSFRVSGKIFVTVPPDELHLHVFPTEEVRELSVAMHPGFMEKLLWGGKVVGVRVALASAKPAVVNALVRSAYEFKARSASAAKTKASPATNTAAKSRRTAQG